MLVVRESPSTLAAHAAESIHFDSTKQHQLASELQA